MRLNNDIRNYLREAITENIPGADVYLFGSRTNDHSRGGDIDILILTKYKIDKRYFRSIRVEFFKKFGWQKLDLVNFTHDDQSPFRKLIQSEAIHL
jgi:uncharacterized protein